MKIFRGLLIVSLLSMIVCSCSSDSDGVSDAEAQDQQDDNQPNGGDDENANSEAPLNATYMITFIGEWTPASHPIDFPNGFDHFSQTILFTHSNEVSLYTLGELASSGIEDVAEVGNNSNIEAEMMTFIDNGQGHAYQIGENSIRGNETDELAIEATQDFSKLSYVAMVAPSPDWFTGLSSISLFEDSTWVESIELDVVAYDAGTEDGNEFRFDNSDTSPRQPIVRISEAPLGNGTSVSPRLGRLIITLQE